MKSGTLAATASAEDSGSDTSHTPAAPTTGPDTGNNTTTKTWLADFFAKHSGADRGTLGFADGASKHGAVALDGDQFLFRHASQAKLGNVQDSSDHAHQAVEQAVAALHDHLPADNPVFADAHDAAQSTIAKIMAQLAGHSGHQTADLVG